MRAIIACGLCILCSACGIYQSNWDCPPGQGIGCKPVTEVLDMIVEQEGEDLFIADPCARQQMRKQPAIQRSDQKLYLLKERSGGAAVIVEGT